jgi:hypothetical protein
MVMRTVIETVTVTVTMMSRKFVTSRWCNDDMTVKFALNFILILSDRGGGLSFFPHVKLEVKV